MAILAGLIGLLTGAFAAGLVTRRRAAAEMRWLRARLEERVGFWQGETERARASAAQAAERTAAWAAGCQQGREDLLSLARTLAQRGIGAAGAISDLGPLAPMAPMDPADSPETRAGSTLARRFVQRTREGEGTGPRTTVRSV